MDEFKNGFKLFFDEFFNISIDYEALGFFAGLFLIALIVASVPILLRILL